MYACDKCFLIYNFIIVFIFNGISFLLFSHSNSHLNYIFLLGHLLFYIVVIEDYEVNF